MGHPVHASKMDSAMIQSICHKVHFKKPDPAMTIRSLTHFCFSSPSLALLRSPSLSFSLFKIQVWLGWFGESWLFRMSPKYNAYLISNDMTCKS